MTTPDQHAMALMQVYGAPDADVTELLLGRHPADAIAFTVIEPDLSSRDLSFGDLAEASARFAAGLAALGVCRDDRVATLMGKSAELLIASLGIWRLGAVQVPLFTAFAPPAIATRIRDNNTKVVIVDPAQRAKLAPSADMPADGGWRIVTTGAATDGDLSFAELLDHPDLAPEPVAVGGEGTVIELFTSGTTGNPKGVPVPVKALAGIHIYQHYGLDHTDQDVFWNAADPGWGYGLFYAIIGPLVTGRRSLLLHAAFSPELTWRVLSEFGVTNFAAGPTVYRALRAAEVPVPGNLTLRHCSAAGEPLTPEVITWSEQALGCPVRDHYGQTETGMTVANAWHPELIADIKSGSMGRVLPGITIQILDAEVDEPAPAGQVGRVAVDVPASPLMPFSGYANAPEPTAARFSPDRRWYYTGDLASMDVEGYLRFGSRDDDVILMAGYRIGPFEVESVLVQHNAVAEAAVIGVPDQLRGEVVVAFVVPRPGADAGENLAAELKQLVKTRFAAHAYPRVVYFVPELPRNVSGKVQRFLLRQQATEVAQVRA